MKVDVNESFVDGTAYEVISYINMFHVQMVFVVLGDGNGRDVVEVDGDGFHKWVCNLTKEHAYPKGFFHSMSCCYVFGFSC